MYTQPALLIPPEIELGLLNGTLKLFGGVVRDSDTGHIVKHLNEMVPTSEAVESAVKRLNFKAALPVLAVTVVVAGASTYLVKKRAKATRRQALELRPQCVTDFEASLGTYVEAGRDGALTAEIVESLLVDLDALKSFSESGNDVRISLEVLVPLFKLVIAHTPRLAEAYDVDLEDIGESASDSADNIMTLRHHLSAQRSILADAA